MRDPAPDFRILGPLDVSRAGERLELGGARQRGLLAVLLLHANQFVPATRLVDALWGDAPPPSAQVTLRTHVAHLRRRLSLIGADDALVTRPAGYGLVIDPDQVDAHRFERLVGEGQEALGLGAAAQAADLLAAALAEWRGPLLDDLSDPVFALTEAARLGELRLVAVERRIDADLALGRDVVAEVEQLVEAHPFRERFCGQLMVALYRAGRQVDALAAYSAMRDRLADELGLDTGPALAELETAILRHDPVLLPMPASGAYLRPGGDGSGARHLGAVARSRAASPGLPPPDALFTAATRAPMVGRAVQLGLLVDAWTDIRREGHQVVLVSGEAGVGKTRLVAQLADHVTHDEGLVLVGRCDPLAGRPYQPLLAAVEQSGEAAALLADAPEAVRDALARRGAPDTPGRPGAPGEDVDEVGERLALQRALQWVLAHLAQAAPVLLVVEDAERMDRATSLLLSRLATALPDRVMLLLGFRDPPGRRHRPLGDLLGDHAGLADAVRLALEPLSEPDLAELVARLRPDGAPEGFVAELWSSTGGNPYFATELIRDLRVAGGSPDSGGSPGGRGRRTPAGSRGRVPAGVHDVLRHRLLALPEPVQQVLGAAAVIGRDIEFDLLTHVAEQPEDTVLEAVEQAVSAGFLIEAGRSWVGTYEFAHELTREAVYADLPMARRHRWHLRVAQALLAGSSPQLAPAATHLRAAGPGADPVLTAEVSLRAADRAAQLFDWEDAVRHADAAAELLDRAGDPLAAGEAAQRAGLLRLRASIGYPQAVRHLQNALRHFVAASTPEAAGATHSRLGLALATHHSVMDIPRALEHLAAAEHTLAHPESAFHLSMGLSLAGMFGLRNDLLGTASERMEAITEAQGPPHRGAHTDWARGWYHFNRGELTLAAEHREAAWARAHVAADPYSAWGAVSAAALCATDYLLDPVEGRSWCRRGLSQPRFDTFAYPHTAVLDQLVQALAMTGDVAKARDIAGRLTEDAVAWRLLHYLDGEWERAIEAWASALAVDLDHGDRHDAAFNARWLGVARRRTGDLDGAVAALDEALALALDGPQLPTELAARADLARLLARLGDLDAARRHLARCDAIVDGGEDWRGRLGAVQLARAVVSGLSGDDPSDQFEAAVETFRAYRVPWEQADALAEWATLLDGSADSVGAAARRAEADRLLHRLGAPARWRHTR